MNNTWNIIFTLSKGAIVDFDIIPATAPAKYDFVKNAIRAETDEDDAKTGDWIYITQ